MFGSAMLDVVIGLVFMYLLLSLICSALAELAEAWLRYRARDLEQGIRTMLEDPTGSGLAKRFYDHPLINCLYLGKYEGDKKLTQGWFQRIKAGPQPVSQSSDRYYSGSNLPSYIPSRAFALALLDTLAPADRGKQSGAGGAATALESQRSLAALRDAVDTAQAPAAVKQAVRTLVDAAGEDIDKARKNIEEWFDSAMERVGGWYRRRAQLIIFLLGFFVAAAMNADSILIANTLAREKPVRDSVVAFAQKYAETAAAPTSDPAKKRLDEAIAQISSTQAVGLPLGLKQTHFDALARIVAPGGKVDWGLVAKALRKLVGLLITAIAISLGAPFWFDLLKKFVSVRSAGKLESGGGRKGGRAAESEGTPEKR